LSDALPYVAREGLLSPGELAFFRSLRRAIGGRYSISIKTRLCDVVRCPEEFWDTPHGRRISQKHLDFILYDSWTTAIVAAIELDDRSHCSVEAQAKDRFKEQALEAGGVMLIRIPAAARYNPTDLWSTLQTALSQRAA